MQLDVRTIILAIAAGNVLMAAGYLIVAQNARLPGGRHWIWGNALLATGWLLLAFRGYVPSFVTAIAGNGLLSLGLVLEYEAICRFKGRRYNRSALYACFAAYLLGLAAIIPLGARNAHFVAYTGYFNGAMSLLMVRQILGRAVGRARSADVLVASAFALFAIIVLVRSTDAALGGPTSSLLAQTTVQSIFFGTVYVSTITASFGFILMTKQAVDAELQKLAMTDPLTGLTNRRAFMQTGVRELNRARRHGNAVSVLMLDIDHFKKINDTLGHAGGDEILRDFARNIRESIRESDIAGRYGGEEFALVLGYADITEAQSIAERIRAGCGERYSVSIGITNSTPPDERSLEELLQTADAALYAAKNAGRNRVVTIDGASTDQKSSSGTPS